MNQSLFEEILRKSFELAPSEREILAQRLQRMTPADPGLPSYPYQSPKPEEPLPDAQGLLSPKE